MSLLTPLSSKSNGVFGKTKPTRISSKTSFHCHSAENTQCTLAY